MLRIIEMGDALDRVFESGMSGNVTKVWAKAFRRLLYIFMDTPILFN